PPTGWTATTNQPWLRVSPTSGTGSATLTVSVVSIFGTISGALTGAVNVTLVGSGTATGSIAVTLNVFPNGSTSGPFGVIDTPTNNATGVTGAVPFSGWGLDDEEVTTVSIC